VSLLFRSFEISSNVSSRCRLRLRFACPGMNLRMPLLPETLLPSRLDSWLALLGDFSRVESADPLKSLPGLPTSSLFRPRREIELALPNTFFTALRGGEVTGEGAVGDSMVPQGKPKLVACARLAAENYVGIGIGDDAAGGPSMLVTCATTGAPLSGKHQAASDIGIS
jgi:hypothetical protein